VGTPQHEAPSSPKASSRGRIVIDCTIVHQLPGRVRLRVHKLRTDLDFAARVTQHLLEQSGIVAVRASSPNASLVVTYDAKRVTLVRIIAWLGTTKEAKGTAVAHAGAGPGKAAVVCGAIALGMAALGAPVALTSAVLLVSAAPIAVRASRSLVADRRVTVDTLDFTAVSVLTLRGNVFAASLTACLIALGEYIRALTARRSRGSLFGLLATTGQEAWVVRGRFKERVPADSLVCGDTIVCYPGDSIHVDGVVLKGNALVDQKTLTGESTPILKQAGDAVYAATLVTDGKIYVRAERVGVATRAHQIVRMLEDAPMQDTRITNYAGKIADRLVVPTLVFAAGVYMVTGNVARAVSIIVFDFATGIRVSAPTTVMASLAKAVRSDVLIKSGRALERLAQMDALVFDKTGTLTVGTAHVMQIQALAAHATRDDVLRYAAAAEQRLSHPAAAAIVQAARARQIALPERNGSRYTMGMGIEAGVEGHCVLVGNPRFILSHGVTLSKSVTSLIDAGARKGASAALVALDGDLIGLISYADAPRPEAQRVIQQLRDRGVREIVMVTGDSLVVGRAVARHVGIDRVEAEALPDEKAAFVRRLQREGHVVGVMGDGINDSPALKYADVSISLKAGTDVARETADIVLHGDLHGLPAAVDVARESMSLIRQNLALVVAPNTVGLVLAGTGLIGPIPSAALNNGSTVLAAINGLRPLLPSRDAPSVGPPRIRG
jgi:Cu2+-exporting ATPase